MIMEQDVAFLEHCIQLNSVESGSEKYVRERLEELKLGKTRRFTHPRFEPLAQRAFYLQKSLEA